MELLLITVAPTRDMKKNTDFDLNLLGGIVSFIRTPKATIIPFCLYLFFVLDLPSNYTHTLITTLCCVGALYIGFADRLVILVQSQEIEKKNPKHRSCYSDIQIAMLCTEN